ncbi:MAG: HD domain-containing protein [Acidobacteriota bacterium]
MSQLFVRRRRQLQADEETRLSLIAIRSLEATRRRPVEEDPSDIRLEFQRDRDRILHARAFRRLKHKTQVFVPHVGDHPRTRLTHTLEVGQLARTIARALGLNEDLAEAVAMGHDLGHTAFGHTGETVLDEILRGVNTEVALPEAISRAVGRFKHNYQSLRVVDLFERRYDTPGLNLSDQVREAILKHTSWKVDFPFPVHDCEGLHLDLPCHLEGQAVAIADEIAQQTHDLEDGLRAGLVSLETVEELPVARRVIGEIGSERYFQDRRWIRQSSLVRGLIRLFVSDVVESSVARIEAHLDRHGISDHEAFVQHAREISQTTVWLSPEIEELFMELKSFIYAKIINQGPVNRQDYRARKVMTALFGAYWSMPTIAPDYLLMRVSEELNLPYLREVPLKRVAGIVAERYHSTPGYARLIVDHLAGMSDRFALEEYRALELPSPDRNI